MLTLEQIIELQGKGFTYEQLQTLNNMNVNIGTTPEPEKKPEPEPELDPEKKAEPEPEKKENEAGDVIKSLKEEIGALTDTIKAMQDANAQNAKQELPKTESVEDIIQSFMVAS